MIETIAVIIEYCTKLDYMGKVVYIIPFGVSFLTKLYTDRMIFLLILIAAIMTYLSVFFIYRNLCKGKEESNMNPQPEVDIRNTEKGGDNDAAN